MIQSCPHCGVINGNADEHTVFCPNCGEPYPALSDMTVQMPPLAAPGGATAGYDASPYAASPYGGTPYPPVSRAGTLPPPPPGARRNARRVQMGGLIGGIMVGLGIVLLIVVVLAASALTRNNDSGIIARTVTATPSPTHTRPTATPHPPTATATAVPLIAYNDPQLRFTVQYPETWATNMQSGRINGVYPSTTTTFATPPLPSFSVLITVARISNTALHTVIADNGGTNIQQVGGTGSATYGGASWHVVTATFTDASGTPCTAQMLYLRHNDLTSYAIFLVARQSQFTQVNGTIFVPMLRTFTFGANPAA